MKHHEVAPEKSAQPHQVASQTQKVFNVWGIILAIWAVYRSTIGVSSPLFFDEVILKPLLFITPVIFFIKNFEHRSIAEGLWLNKKDLLKNVKLALLLSIPVLVLFLLSFLSSQPTSLEVVLLLIPVAFGMSISEEILSRGFVARRIWEEKHSIVRTIIQASILHMFLRIPRIMTTPGLFGQKLILFILADLILSIALTTILIWKKSLYPVIVVRFLYTFLLMVLLAR